VIKGFLRLVASRGRGVSHETLDWCELHLLNPRRLAAPNTIVNRPRGLISTSIEASHEHKKSRTPSQRVARTCVSLVTKSTFGALHGTFLQLKVPLRRHLSLAPYTPDSPPHCRRNRRQFHRNSSAAQDTCVLALPFVTVLQNQHIPSLL
jgi:hypothetical protein